MTPFVFLDTFKFYNAKPGPVTTLLTLVYPFEENVWRFSVASLIFATFASMLIRYKTTITKFRMLQLVLAPLVSDSSSTREQVLVHKNWYGFVVLFIWFMCGLLLSQAYTSNLLASLTVVTTDKADNTFQVKYQDSTFIFMW